LHSTVWYIIIRATQYILYSFFFCSAPIKIVMKSIFVSEKFLLSSTSFKIFCLKIHFFEYSIDIRIFSSKITTYFSYLNILGIFVFRLLGPAMFIFTRKNSKICFIIFLLTQSPTFTLFTNCDELPFVNIVWGQFGNKKGRRMICRPPVANSV